MTGSVLAALAPAKVHEGPEEPLDEYLAKVEGRRKRVLYSLYARVKDIYRHKGRSAEELREADEALGGLEAGPGGEGQLPLAELAAQHSALSGQLAACTARRAELQRGADFSEGLQRCQAALDAGDYEEAVRQQDGLEGAAAEEGPLPPPLLERHAQLRGRLTQEVVSKGRASLEADTLAQTLQVTLPPKPLSLWAALELLGRLDDALKVCAASLQQELVLPMLSCPEPLGVDTGAVPPGGPGAATGQQQPPLSFSIPWTTGEQSGEGAPSAAQQAQQGAAGGEGTFEAALLQLLRALSSSVFMGHEASVASLGRHLWPPLASAYISQRLARALPADASELDSFQAAAKRAQRFEEAAAQLGYVPTDGGSRGRIQEYVRHALDKHVHSRRLQVVEEARQLLLLPTSETLVMGSEEPLGSHPGHQGEETTGEGAAPSLGRLDSQGEDAPLLATGRYRVTCSAVALVGLAHRACAAAVAAGSPAVARSLVAAVVDAAELAAIIPPATRSQALQEPQQAALFYCDCQHLARELLQLPYCYAPALRALCSSAPGMLREAARRLRDAGAALLQEQVTHQCQALADMVAAAEGWRWLADPSRASAAQGVAAQAAQAVSRLSEALQPTLPPGAYHAALGSAVDTVCAMICRDVLALADISARDSEEFPRVLGPLLQQLPPAVLGGEPAGAAEPPGEAAAGQEAELGRLVPSFRKLQAIVELMAARLADFRGRWLDGRLQGAGLSAAEATHLVRALFEDTAVRRETLQALSSQPSAASGPPGG